MEGYLMRIVRFLDDDNRICLGTDVKDNSATLLSGELFGSLTPTQERRPVKQWLTPVNPPAVLCVGLNYRAHAAETGMELPKYPVLFMKNPASIIGHQAAVVIPESCRDPLQVDYEVEMAMVIGKAAKNVAVENALDYVAGYTVANDVSARIWQGSAGAGQWVRGKSFDTFCPLGPALVTPEEVPDPDTLDIKCILNGTVMQESNTSDLIFPTRELISYLSEDTTLLPGTVILTGTPSGVGFTRNPPVYLKPGDRIEMTVEKLGTLVNSVK
jgi:2-keto-4-pentenoate hydratase/2-oxohepta-3-ene-1,7-dioic acid hydratase in catechol pathway